MELLEHQELIFLHLDVQLVDLTTGVVTVTAPGAGNLQINSMMVYAPSSETDPITVNIPAGDSNSGGINSALDTRFIPLCTFYKVDGVSPVLSTATVTAYIVKQQILHNIQLQEDHQIHLEQFSLC